MPTSAQPNCSGMHAIAGSCKHAATPYPPPPPPPDLISPPSTPLPRPATSSSHTLFPFQLLLVQKDTSHPPFEYARATSEAESSHLFPSNLFPASFHTTPYGATVTAATADPIHQPALEQ
ncbi:hypothetical protein C0Q70_10072 [Pomacea canaliculata]|uniref:Uncharacterized protein n=1 Tax=Pomacea canaliculata TaxID=400727 RepID=A0A2T7PBK4_POMCA|nr:hypothetical protein C0Q70_10072 [Pomacea canaliculata]